MASVGFRNRRDAGERLGQLLASRGLDDPVVLGLPRGGVVVAAEVARRLGAPLDVIIVRKLGAPHQPELALGAIGEDGVQVMNPGVERVDPATLAQILESERAELARRTSTYRISHDPIPLADRIALVVDDGVATGATAMAACRVARAHGADQVVLAVPVAPRGWQRAMGDVADEYVAVTTPRNMWGVGRFYDDFTQVTDAEVVAALDAQAGGR